MKTSTHPCIDALAIGLAAVLAPLGATAANQPTGTPCGVETPYGMPQIQRAVVREDGTRLHRLDRAALAESLASGCRINNQDAGGDGVIDAVISSNTLAGAVAAVKGPKVNASQVQAFLDDVEYLLDMGAIPNVGSVRGMDRIVDRGWMHDDTGRLARVADRVKGTHADYLVRLDAYEANPSLPAVERLRPYLTAEELYDRRTAGE
jgi:hypothetical protein